MVRGRVTGWTLRRDFRRQNLAQTSDKNRLILERISSGSRPAFG